MAVQLLPQYPKNGHQLTKLILPSRGSFNQIIPAYTGEHSRKLPTRRITY